MSDQQKSLQIHQPQHLTRWVSKAFDLQVQLDITVKGAAIQLKDIKPVITQALLDELKERWKESGW